MKEVPPNVPSHLKRNLRRATVGAIAWVAACNVYDASLVGLGLDDGNAGAPGTSGDGNGPAGSPGEAGMPGASGGEGGAPVGGTGNPDPQGGNPPVGGSTQGGTSGTSTAGDAGEGGEGGEGGQGGSAGAPGCTPKPASILRDADDDGIIDVFDDDDDNDGIPDLEECFPTATRFVNPGFETPVVTDVRGWQYVPQSLVPGWDTDAPAGNIEIWSTLGPAAVGAQHIEVSTQQPDTVGQVITTVPGSTLRWGFYFRSRDPGINNILVIRIGPPGAPAQQGQFTTANLWQIYEGEYTVPAGQTMTRFEFQGVPVDGSDTSHLDHVDAEPICTMDSDGDGCVDSEDPD